MIPFHFYLGKLFSWSQTHVHWTKKTEKQSPEVINFIFIFVWKKVFEACKGTPHECYPPNKSVPQNNVHLSPSSMMWGWFIRGSSEDASQNLVHIVDPLLGGITHGNPWRMTMSMWAALNLTSIIHKSIGKCVPLWFPHPAAIPT